MGKIDVKALALALGITWGAAVMLMDLAFIMTGWGGAFVDAMGEFYLGYQPTVIGSVIGFVWGFIDLGIGGAVIALIYNKFAK
jgi:hypothetical protein